MPATPEWKVKIFDARHLANTGAKELLSLLNASSADRGTVRVLPIGDGRVMVLYFDSGGGAP